MSKTAKIGDRIKVLKEKLGGKSDRELEMGGLPGGKWLISNGLLSKWESKNLDFSSTTLDTFLNHYKVNRAWWQTGEGEVFIVGSLEKHTHGEKSGDNTGKRSEESLDELLEKVEASDQYYVIPRAVLKENYRLVALEQFQIEKEKLEKERDEMKRQAEKDRVYLDAQIEANRDLSRKLDMLIAKLTEVQKSQ